MPEDWFADVQKYAATADPDHVGGIVRYCGIALRKRDSALVSFSSAEETARVRDNFLKKKLGLTEPDSVLDAAIAAVGERMKGDRSKNRVTVYYLLADHFGRLDDFIKPAKGGAKPAAASPAGAQNENPPPMASDAGERREPTATEAGASGSESAPSTSPESSTPAAAKPDFATAGEAQTSPGHAPAFIPPTEFGRRASEVRAAARSESSAGGIVHDRPADTQRSAGSRWWLWALLIVAVVIVLFVLLR
jgi:hypothetical protein